MSDARRRAALVLALALAGPVGCGASDPGSPDAGGGGDGSVDWGSCEVSSDCVLAANSCCGGCGAPTLDDVDAVNRGRVDQHRQDVCPAPVPCPLCAQAQNPNLIASCEAGSCAALDVTELSVSSCTSDDQCRLRAR